MYTSTDLRIVFYVIILSLLLLLFPVAHIDCIFSVIPIYIYILLCMCVNKMKINYRINTRRVCCFLSLYESVVGGRRRVVRFEND